MAKTPGPPPKRSEQRRRRNKDGGEVEKVTVTQALVGPELLGEHSDEARRFWQALRESGQAQWFQPSDWAAAELVVVAIDTFVKKPSAMMLASINSAMSNLLVTEGDRRRIRLELERDPEEASPDVSWIDEYRRNA